MRRVVKWGKNLTSETSTLLFYSWEILHLTTYIGTTWRQCKWDDGWFSFCKTKASQLCTFLFPNILHLPLGICMVKVSQLKVKYGRVGYAGNKIQVHNSSSLVSYLWACLDLDRVSRIQFTTSMFYSWRRFGSTIYNTTKILSHFHNLTQSILWAELIPNP